MRTIPFLLLLCAAAAGADTTPTYPALTYSTYLRDSFMPQAIATDAAGNIYLAGAAIVDAATSQTTALVLKLNPQATEYVYVRDVGGSVNDHANAITVDSAGNAYIAGWTESPDFPVTAGGNLASAPGASLALRSFLTKLDASGNILFSDVIGGAAGSNAQAVALTASGQIVVSGVSVTSGFPTTSGAYSVTNTTNHPYLLELDATGTKVVFSATGIGGSAMVIDTAGDIYIAGSTQLLDYPTTPGAYQTTFPSIYSCVIAEPCPTPGQASKQYVSKIDPTGSKLIYSTALTGSDQTTNAGLAIDSAGDVYVTGYSRAGYPYSSSLPPSLSAGIGTPFLTKLDPLGQTLLFSVPVGGAGVALDSAGNVYVGGGVGLQPDALYLISPSLPALEGVAPQCLPQLNSPYSTFTAAYASEVDSATGAVRGTQFIQGSNLAISGVALSGAELWMAGATALPDVPFTPGAIVSADLSPVPGTGAYLGAVDFAQPALAAGTPQIGCIMDAANLLPAGLASASKLLTVFGTNLGPATAVSASGVTDSLGGDMVSFAASNNYFAPLLYASSTQVNLAVPPVAGSPTMTLTVNGISGSPRVIPVTAIYPSLFENSEATAAALNADGSVNSASNPAMPDSAISLFVNGAMDLATVGGEPGFSSDNGWQVTGIVALTPYVLQVALQPVGPVAARCGTSGPCLEQIDLNLVTNEYGIGLPNQLTGFSGMSISANVHVSQPD